MTKNKIIRKVMAALDVNNKLIADPAEVDNLPGFSTAYLGALGLTKSDLNYLVSQGLARRGYVERKIGAIYNGSVTEVRWILLRGANE